MSSCCLVLQLEASVAVLKLKITIIKLVIMAMKLDVRGILAPVFTPMHEDGQLNLQVVPDYAKYLHSHKIPGIMVAGTTGEDASLNLSERKALIKAWVDAAKPLNIKVLSHVGGQPLPDVLELAKYSAEIGSDAIMTIADVYFKPNSAEQVVSYLETVGKAAPNLPLVYYNSAMISGINISQFYSLAKERVPNFRGMKSNFFDAVEVSDLVEDSHQIYISNHVLAPSALMGYESSTATVTNMFPELVYKIVDAVKRGEVAEARDGQLKLNRLVDAIGPDKDYVPTFKAAMELMTDVKVGPARKPNIRLSDAKKTQMKDQLKLILSR